MPAVAAEGAGAQHGEELRLLTVHAHADDESITMGGSLALLHDQGVRTALVTCTDGQLATIFDPTMDEETTRPILGEVRRREMAEAARILGLDEFHFLGYRDSGMAGAETNHDAEAFWRVDVDEAVGRVVERIRAFRPQVVVTYNANGGYGHPDHIQAHRVTLLAVAAAAEAQLYPGTGPCWGVSKLYYTAFARSAAQRFSAAMAAARAQEPEADSTGSRRGRRGAGRRAVLRGAGRADLHLGGLRQRPGAQARRPDRPPQPDRSRLAAARASRGDVPRALRHRGLPAGLQPRRRSRARDGPLCRAPRNHPAQSGPSASVPRRAGAPFTLPRRAAAPASTAASGRVSVHQQDGAAADVVRVVHRRVGKGAHRAQLGRGVAVEGGEVTALERAADGGHHSVDVHEDLAVV